jgi:hypothetical protein
MPIVSVAIPVTMDWARGTLRMKEETGQNRTLPEKPEAVERMQTAIAVGNKNQ